jgi:tetratricopeptide (TPR) repeat protein
LLFGTAKFNLKSATIVTFGKKSSKDETVENQRELQMILLLFKSRHLIEIEDTDGDESYETDSNIEREHTEHKLFSLHPLVYKFLTERSKDKDVFEEIQKAKYNYLSLYNELVIKIGTTYDTNVLLAREKCEKQRVHISKYIQLLEEHENVLSAKEAKSISKVVEMIHIPENHLSFLQSMCAKGGQPNLTKCSWEIEHVTAMIQYEKPCSNIDQRCNDILNKLDSLSTEEFNEIEKEQFLIFRGRMLLNKSKILLDICDGEDQMKVLFCAEKVFKSKCLSRNIDCKLFLADVYNSIGCNYYTSGETDKSIRMHEKAIIIHCESKCQNESTLSFYANIGACHYRLGIQHKRDSDKSMFEKKMKYALQFYTDSLSIAVDLKLGMTTDYVKKLRKRGDVYIMLGKFDDAENDYKDGLRIIKTLFTTTSRLEILLRHGLGNVFWQRIKQRHRERYSRG